MEEKGTVERWLAQSREGTCCIYSVCQGNARWCEGSQTAPEQSWSSRDQIPDPHKSRSLCSIGGVEHVFETKISLTKTEILKTFNGGRSQQHWMPARISGVISRTFRIMVRLLITNSTSTDESPTANWPCCSKSYHRANIFNSPWCSIKCAWARQVSWEEEISLHLCHFQIKVLP